MFNAIKRAGEKVGNGIKPNIIGLNDDTGIYFKYPFLAQYSDLLGNLQINSIIGKGMDSIIVKNPNDYSEIIKFAYPGKTESLTEEYRTHKKFYKTLEKGKIKYKGKLSDTIKIPYLGKIKKGYFFMERVLGQNLNTKFYREYYKKELKYSTDFLDNLTDIQFQNILDFENLETLSVLISDDDPRKDLSKKLKQFTDSYIYGTELGNVLDFFEWKGLFHNDFNPGNIMIGNNGNIYLIDFGKSKDKKANKII